MTALQLVKRKLDKRLAVFLAMDDPRAKEVLVGWTIYSPPYKDFSVSEDADPRDVLRRLWDGVQVDFDELARICRRPVSRVRRLFDSLRAAHLLWPDGTLAESVDILLLAEGGLRMQGMVPKELRGRPVRREP